MELPRSRALILLDGPGHIMPMEPVTPPDSAAWRIIHVPIMLASMALCLLLLAGMALGFFGPGLQVIIAVPGLHYLVPLLGTLAIVLLYGIFVRLIERRRDMMELGVQGWWWELACGALGGLALSGLPFLILVMGGNLRIEGFNPPGLMLLPLVLHSCTAITLEIILCGIGFRLIERWLGSWIALVATMVFFAVMRSAHDEAMLTAAIAVAIEAGVLFGAVFMVTRRLWGPFGVSAAWKVAQIGLYGAATTDRGPQGWVQARVAGPDIITGGGAGPDASLPAIIVAGLGLAVLLIVAVRRGRIVRPAWQRGKSPPPVDAG